MLWRKNRLQTSSSHPDEYEYSQVLRTHPSNQNTSPSPDHTLKELFKLIQPNTPHRTSKGLSDPTHYICGLSHSDNNIQQGWHICSTVHCSKLLYKHVAVKLPDQIKMNLPSLTTNPKISLCKCMYAYNLIETMNTSTDSQKKIDMHTQLTRFRIRYLAQQSQITHKSKLRSES